MRDKGLSLAETTETERLLLRELAEKVPGRQSEVLIRLLNERDKLESDHQRAIATPKLRSDGSEMLSALRAIVARIDGVFDDPDLMRFGPLATLDADIRDIANEVLCQFPKDAR